MPWCWPTCLVRSLNGCHKQGFWITHRKKIAKRQIRGADWPLQISPYEALQKSAYSVYGQWRASPSWYHFQNYVEQNFIYVPTLWNKIENIPINGMGFIAFSKKEVMLPHPVVHNFLSVKSTDKHKPNISFNHAN